MSMLRIAVIYYSKFNIAYMYLSLSNIYLLMYIGLTAVKQIYKYEILHCF